MAEPGREEAGVHEAVASGQLHKVFSKKCIEGLKKGRALVVMHSGFGWAAHDLQIMEEFGPVGTLELPDVIERPMLFSDMFGLPLLWRFTPAVTLESDYKVTPNLLTNVATPLSSLFGMRVLSKSKKDWKTSFGIPLLSNKAAPLSSMSPRDHCFCWVRTAGL
ncbi:MAG: hypothetical protein HC923_00100 [Myxococcales bacterium]|nr:hypothetical protein [Myxococcales bacterium]